MAVEKKSPGETPDLTVKEPVQEKSKAPAKDSAITLRHPTVITDGSFGMYAGGEEIQLHLKNGKIELKLDQVNIRDALLKEGWIDETNYGLSVSNPAPESIPSQRRPVRWHLAHPNASEKNPVNAVIGVYLRGEEKKIIIKENYTVSEDQELTDILMREKFVLMKVDTE